MQFICNLISMQFIPSAFRESLTLSLAFYCMKSTVADQVHFTFMQLLLEFYGYIWVVRLNNFNVLLASLQKEKYKKSDKWIRWDIDDVVFVLETASCVKTG